MRILALLVLLWFAGAAHAREVLPLERGWRFQMGDAPGAETLQLDDSAWQPVDLPHSWNRLGSYTLSRSPDTRVEQRVGWYRLALDTRWLREGERHILEFDGAGNIAELWVNEVKIGRHAGAFSRFRFDITDAVRGRSRTLIAVRADNSRPAPASSTADTLPLLGDFFIHGGLYRGVRLISVGAVHFDLLDHGGPGLYAHTERVDGRSARVAVRARLRNTGGVRALALVVAMRDAAGRSVARSVTPLMLSPGATVTAQRVTVVRPRLWSGRADPYRYTIVAELRDGARVVDRVTQKFGIRTFRIDPALGFFLNGRHLPLRGVSRHQDWLGKGWALTAADHARDIALITEMGANTIRFAHYQHADEWFEAADAAGMVVWAEIPFVNKVAFDDSPATPALVANARSQTIELIRQNYNRASVVTWGIGNEVDIDMAFNRLGPKADARLLLRELHALAKAEDPNRPTVIADCCEATPGAKAPYLPVLTGIADLMGYNRYFGWYYGAVDDLGPHLDRLRVNHPRVPLSVSEYGAGGATSQHSDNPEGGPIDTPGRPHPEDSKRGCTRRVGRSSPAGVICGAIGSGTCSISRRTSGRRVTPPTSTTRGW